MSEGSSARSCAVGRGCSSQAARQALPERAELTERQPLLAINYPAPERQRERRGGQPRGTSQGPPAEERAAAAGRAPCSPGTTPAAACGVGTKAAAPACPATNTAPPEPALTTAGVHFYTRLERTRERRGKHLLGPSVPRGSGQEETVISAEQEHSTVSVGIFFL